MKKPPKSPPKSTAIVPRPSSPSEALARLAPTIDAARAFRSAAKSPATRRAYATAWHLFSEWCEVHHFLNLPAETATLVLYLTHLAQLGRKVSSIEQARSAISVAHQFAAADFKKRGLEAPGQECPNPSFSIDVKETMKGIRRTVGVAKNKKTPVLMEDMLAMLALCPSTIRSDRDRALLAIGFTGAFRRSELVAINIEHLIFEEEGVVVFVPRSKTDQEGVGRHVGIPYAAQDPCPVRLLRTWIARLNHCGITEGPVFRRVHRARDGHTLGDGLALGDKALTGESAAEVVKKYAQMIGKDPTQFGGHSLRSGFATQSIMDEVPEAEIMRQTGHKSVVVFREYVRRASVFQGNAAKGIWK